MQVYLSSSQKIKSTQTHLSVFLEKIEQDKMTDFELKLIIILQIVF